MERFLESLRNRPWGPLLVGLGTGLYVSRVVAEATARPWPLGMLVPLVLSCAAAGTALSLCAHSKGLNLSPLAVLWAYVLWPRLSPSLAAATAFIAVVSLLLKKSWRREIPAPDRSVTGQTSESQTRREQLLLDVLVFMGALILYISTLAPTVLPADSGEFQLVGYLLGVAHPPGYPLYTLLAKLATLLPVGDVAYRVNLLSAFTSALTVAVVGSTVRRVSGSAVAGLVASLTLGVSTTFWAQATTANIRSLMALFTALPIWALTAWEHEKHAARSTQRATRFLLVFAFTYGLGVSHHASLLFLAPAYVAYLLSVDPGLVRRGRVLARMLVVFLVPFLAWLYIPLRAWTGAPFGTGNLTSAGRVIDHLLGRGFGGDMFYYLRRDQHLLGERVRVLGDILMFQFGGALLALALLGALVLLVRNRRLLLLCGGIFAINAFIVATYHAPQTVEYFMPAYVPLVVVLGSGLGCCKSQITNHKLQIANHKSPIAICNLVLALALFLGVALGWGHYPSYAALHRDRSAREYAEALLRDAPPEAVVLSNWHLATPLWYLQLVEGWRPDVEVRYVYPGGEPMAVTWQRRIQEVIGRRPLIVTQVYHEYGALPYRFTPIGNGEAFLVHEGPLTELPSDLVPLGITLGGRVRLRGYRVEYQALTPSLPRTGEGEGGWGGRGEGHVPPGHSLTVLLAWEPVQPLDRPYSFFVQLLGGGQVLAQDDVTHVAAPDYQVGEVLIDRFVLPVLPAATPGRYTLIAGCYFTEGNTWTRLTTPDGADAVTLGLVEVAPAQQPPVTRHAVHQPFAGGPTLVGVDYDGAPQGMRVYLHWYRPHSQEEPLRIAMTGAYRQEQNLLPPGPAHTYATTVHDLDPQGLYGRLYLELRTADGRALPPLGPWNLPRPSQSTTLPNPDPGSRYVPLGGEMVLMEARFERRELAPGETLPLRLRFLSAHPLTHDYMISAQLVDAQGHLLAQDDSPPALGAVPTLKWIRGSRVGDPRFLTLPADFSGDAVELRVTVYDWYTLRPLAVLDDRLTRLGIGPVVPLGSLQVSK